MSAQDRHNYAVLLAGGSGTRFWPQSRMLEPKQFLSLHRDSSLFEQTILRIKPLIRPDHMYVATSELYRHQLLEITARHNIPEQNIIYEPTGKNTAPSIGVSVRVIHNLDAHARIAVLPCDHLIKNSRIFLRLLRKALSLCAEELVIFGIVPHRPATGYGYIKAGSCRRQSGGQVCTVDKFCEKPDMRTARRFLKAGNYYWNSGMFVGSSTVFLKEFAAHLPGLFKQLSLIAGPSDIVGVWEKIEAISFDYGILERARRVIMLPARGLEWSDLGSWQAWDEVSEKDKQGNLLKADVVNLESRNVTVLGTGKRLIATIGLEDLIVVDTPDALLITRKDKTEQVKKIVDMLKEQKRQEHYAHKTVKRPWGTYTVLDTGDGFKVKLVEVKPGQALSLQYHGKRSEHWVVVEGVADITRENKVIRYQPNESTYIPVGCTHRLANPSKDAMLKIIEVQAGKYLEEDDIIRLKDDFGRK